MRTKSLAILSLLTLTVAGAAQAQDWRNNPAIPVDLREKVSNSFIFVFGDDIGASQVVSRANAMAEAAGGHVTHVYSASIRGFSAKMSAEAAAQLAARNPTIAYYEPDNVAFASGKPSWAGGGGGSDCTAEETPWGVGRVGGPIGPGAGKAWIIDTGIDPKHDDLKDLVEPYPTSINFASGKPNAFKDGNGHGTHVAGTIAALDNDCDVVGVAPGTTLVAVRVLGNSGMGSYADVIAGVDYVAANATPYDVTENIPGDVANMSLGGPKSDALNTAVINAAAKGIRFAVAAGNSKAHAGDYSPASAEHTNIFTVSAINQNDIFASFSNFGNPPVDCAAPGVGVLSLAAGGGTATMSGTSMAAPHVAGILLFLEPSRSIGFNGFAIDDRDNNPDPICYH